MYVPEVLENKKRENGSEVVFENILVDSLETCILSYVKRIGSPGLMHEAGCSGLVHWDDPRDRRGREVGRGFRMGNTCTPMADSCECMAKTTTVL